MEKEVESLFCGAHVEGRSTTVREGQAGEAEKQEDAVVNGQREGWLSGQDEDFEGRGSVGVAWERGWRRRRRLWMGDDDDDETFWGRGVGMVGHNMK